MDDQQIQHLLKKYRQGTVSETELETLNTWYRNTGYTDADYPDGEEVVKQRILAKLQEKIVPLKRAKQWALPLKVGIAAAVALVILTVGYFSQTKYFRKDGFADIAPGSNKAILTLANGKTISLTDALEGDLSEEQDFSITKTKDGQVVYRSNKESDENRTEDEQVLWNTISTPRGGQYQIVMPDGTVVWLNAASSIRFPVSFRNSKNRKVEMNGEAYFEVAKDKLHPFIVESGDQRVQVLGTHFNISSYTEEHSTRTTLLEGSVKVYAASGEEMVLKPNQQAILNENGLQVRTADIAQVMAWKNALFVFDHEDLGSIMNKISRWYDVEVVYLNEEVRNEVFSGKVSRFENVSEVLKKLSLTDAVKFKIERRRILVMK
jgi:transmembrane sensor